MKLGILIFLIGVMFFSFQNANAAEEKLKTEEAVSQNEVPETTFPKLPAVSPQKPQTAQEAMASAVE